MRHTLRERDVFKVGLGPPKPKIVKLLKIHNRTIKSVSITDTRTSRARQGRRKAFAD